MTVRCRCGKRAAKGRKSCRACLRALAAKKKARRDAFIASGKCGNCGGEVVPGKRQCAKHLAYNRDMVNALYRRRHKAGKCVPCGEPVDRPGVYCARCRAKVAKWKSRKPAPPSRQCAEAGCRREPAGHAPRCSRCQVKHAHKRWEHLRIVNKARYWNRRLRGECVQCPEPPKPAEPGRSRCAEHLRKACERSGKSRNRQCAADGCDLPTVGASPRCAEHRAEHARTRYKERAAKGMCAQCKMAPEPGRIHCAEHLRKAREKSKRQREKAPELKREQDRRRGARRKAEGLCAQCARPAAPGRLRCAEHLRLAAERTAKHRAIHGR